MVALALAFAAGAAGFVVGRETADDDGPAAAETTGTTETAETETGGTTTAETETGETTETETGETETEGGDQEADGEAVFASAGCGSCHTFEPAGASGSVGPDLGETDLNEDEIRAVVTNGRGGMPSFEGRLSDAEIAAVAEYVASG